MESKLITIYVYEPNDKDLFEQHLDKVIALKETPFKSPNNSADIRELKKVGNVYTGFLASLRLTNLPHLAKINDISERKLPKDDDEALVEKSHFLYSKTTGFLFFQMNGRGFRNPKNFAEILTERFDEVVTLIQKLTGEQEAKLEDNKDSVYKIEFSIANIDPSLLGNSSIEEAIVASAKVAPKIKLTLSYDKRSGSMLDMPISNFWKKIQPQEPSKFIAYSAELDEPIDLLLDRVKFKKQVKTKDDYIVSESAYQKLNECRREFNEKSYK